jgi:hypothetical protein
MRRDDLRFHFGRQRVSKARGTAVGIGLAVVSFARSSGSSVSQSSTPGSTDVKRQYHSETKSTALEQIETHERSQPR